MVRRTNLDYSLVEYGRSVHGAPLLWIPPRAEVCRLLLIAGIHGEESDTTMLLSRALRSMKPTELSETVGVILCANPDGVSLGTRGNARGVDLNRNFPAQNWSATPSSCRWHVDDTSEIAISTGSNPASEPEVAAIIRLIELSKPKQVLSLHGPLDCVDDPDASPLGRWLARETGSPLLDNIGYPTPGSMGSWAKEIGLPLITWEFPIAGMETLSRRFVPVLVPCLMGGAWNENLN